MGVQKLILEGDTQPVYIDETASELLGEARSNYALLELVNKSIIHLSPVTSITATKCGTIKTTTLALALGSQGFRVEIYDGFLVVESGDRTEPLEQVLKNIAAGMPVDIFSHNPNLVFEKFHNYLSDDLLKEDALTSRLDIASLSPLCKNLISQ